MAELKYSRALETEADDYALAFLIKYGVSPTHLAKMLARMQQSSGGEEEGPGYLSTHPSTRERINRFNRAVQGLPVTTKNRDRGEPHDSAPPTPPGIRVRTMAVRYNQLPPA